MASPQSLLPTDAPQLKAGSKKQGRRVYVGIPPTSIATLTSVDVSCPVLEEFKLQRPFLSVAAQALLVANIRIGTKPLNVSSNPISGNVFSEQAINNELSGYIAKDGGAGITLSLTNPTGASVIASGGFLGWAAL